MKKTQRARLLALQALDQATLTAEQKIELAALAPLAAANPDATKDTEDAQPTARTVIAAAFHSLRSGNAVAADLATARAALVTTQGEFTAANARVATVTADLTTARASLAAVTGQLGTLAAFLGLGVADLAGKDAAALQKLFGDKLAAAALEEVAALGIPTGKLPPKSDTGAAGDANEIRAAYHAMPENNPAEAQAKAAYFTKHEKQILTSAAA